MKKASFVIAMVAMFVMGMISAELNVRQVLTHDWEYQRGIGQTEVVADYDWTSFGNEGEPRVHYEIRLWDKEYENYEVVETGTCQKGELDAMCEYAHAYEPVYMARLGK